jgi:4-hydroxy-tetrahydrodipicolinate synthase
MRRFVEMIDCGLSGRLEDGRRHAEALLPLVRALFAEPSPAIIGSIGADGYSARA